MDHVSYAVRFTIVAKWEAVSNEPGGDFSQESKCVLDWFVDKSG